MKSYKSCANRVRVSGSSTYYQYKHSLAHTLFNGAGVLAPSFGVPLDFEFHLEDPVVAYESGSGAPVYIMQKVYLCYDIVYLKQSPFRSNLLSKVNSGANIPINIRGLHMVNQTLEASITERIHTIYPKRSGVHGVGAFVRKNGYAGQTNDSLSEYIFNESNVLVPLSIQATVGERKIPAEPIDSIYLGSPQILEIVNRFAQLWNGEEYSGNMRMMPALCSNGLYGGDDYNGFFYIPFDECEGHECGLDLSKDPVEINLKFNEATSADVKTITYFFPCDIRLLYNKNVGWKVAV